MLLQDEGAAGGRNEHEAGQQDGKEGDAEFQYMHEDERAAAGDTQVCKVYRTLQKCRS